MAYLFFCFAIGLAALAYVLATFGARQYGKNYNKSTQFTFSAGMCCSASYIFTVLGYIS